MDSGNYFTLNVKQEHFCFCDWASLGVLCCQQPGCAAPGRWALRAEVAMTASVSLGCCLSQVHSGDFSPWVERWQATLHSHPSCRIAENGAPVALVQTLSPAWLSSSSNRIQWLGSWASPSRECNHIPQSSWLDCSATELPFPIKKKTKQQNPTKKNQKPPPKKHPEVFRKAVLSRGTAKPFMLGSLLCP